MKLDRRTVCFGMSEIGRTTRRYSLTRLAPLSAVIAMMGERAHLGSGCDCIANRAVYAQPGGPNFQVTRQRVWSVLVLAVLAVLLPVGVGAGSTPYVWPGGKTITVRDYTSNTFNGIVAAEVRAWSAIMPGGTTLRYVDSGFKDCDEIGSLNENSVALNEIWVCSTASVGGKDTWGKGVFYALNRLIVRGYVQIEENGPRTEFERYGIVCHEFGHTLGLGHMKGRETCMTKKRVKREFPGTKDEAALAKRYQAAGSP